eukprot:scaffold192903_cov43-Prasinocladus_malaysianus.AAC.1
MISPRRTSSRRIHHTYGQQIQYQLGRTVDHFNQDIQPRPEVVTPTEVLLEVCMHRGIGRRAPERGVFSLRQVSTLVIDIAPREAEVDNKTCKDAKGLTTVAAVNKASECHKVSGLDVPMNEASLVYSLQRLQQAQTHMTHYLD